MASVSENTSSAEPVHEPALPSLAAGVGAQPQGMRSAVRPARSWRIRSGLAWLVAGCMLPGALISTVSIFADYQHQREQMMANAVATVRGLAAAVDRDLASTQAGLQVLATAPSLLADDLPAFHVRAKGALPYQNVTNYVLLDPAGHQVINTLKPWGATLPLVGGPADLMRVFETDGPVISDLFVGPVTRKPILALGVPVHRSGAVVYCLAAGVAPERITALLRAQRLPADWIGAVLDRQGRLVARTHEAERYVGQSAVPDLVGLASRQTEGRLETVTLEGIPVVTVFSRAPFSKWTVAIGIPKVSLTAGLKQSITRLVITTVALLAAGLWLTWQVGMQRVVQPANRLLERMQRMARGEDAGPRATAGGSVEFAELEDGFDRMREHLQQRSRERDELLQRMTQTLESIHDGFYLLDAHGRFAYINRAAESLLRCERACVLGMSHWALIDAAEAAPMQAAFEQAMATSQPASLELELPSRGLWLEVNAYPAQGGLAVYFRDVAALRHAQRAHEARLVAEAANKAKSEFLSRMSHELRTPLNAVIGFAQILRLDKQDALTDRQRSMIEQMEVAGQHLQEMIRDILDLSSLEAGAMPLTLEAVDAAALANACCRLMSAQAAAADVTIEAAHLSGAAFVRADATRLRQVLLNLLSNAVKYNRAGGRVILSTERRLSDTRFCVRDDGLGMTPEQVEHLFEPFNRLGREAGREAGSGIGLVICRKLVELMGGRLTVVAHEQAGSLFAFTLPNAEASQAAATPLARGEPEPGSYGPRAVLCVEDHPINCKLIEAALLHRPQIKLSFAATVAEAQDALGSQAFDLILLDMQLPDGSGLDVMAWLRAQGRSALPVVVVSADATRETHEAALRCGARHYLRKPVDVKALLSLVDALLAPAAAVAGEVS